MADTEWRDDYGGHSRLFRDRFLVGEVVWYHEPDSNLGARYWVGFTGRDRVEGRWQTSAEAQAAVEAALGTTTAADTGSLKRGPRA